MSFFGSSHSPTRRSSSYSHSTQHKGSERRGSEHRGSEHRSSESKPQYYYGRPAPSSHRGSSYYGSSRAQPRPGLVANALRKIKRLLRRLYDYARRHPMKLFMLVIMPLITGGALADVLRRMGIRLPRALESMVPGMSGGGRSGRYSGGGGFDGGQSLEGVMKLAKMFI